MIPPISSRQQTLLKTILRDYMTDAKPVSSGHLAERQGLDVSSATIRNDMAELTEAGYLQQPHTSAGRIPTEQAWKWYVDNLLHEQEVSRREQTQVAEVIRAYRHSQQELMRRLAKTMAEMVQETVLVAFDKRDTYYTGLSNLFSQPEFDEVDMLQNLSRVVDHFDEIMQQMYDRVDEHIQVLVGRDNPFSPECGAVIARYSLPNRQTGIIGILGPIRQDYNEHVAIVKYATEQLKKP